MLVVYLVLVLFVYFVGFICAWRLWVLYCLRLCCFVLFYDFVVWLVCIFAGFVLCLLLGWFVGVGGLVVLLCIYVC